ncbi:hypothetical protein FQA39_LY08751 [Lamprigera yunnana]|nr:hypothetical protein FQA39_LY08751 [Lamprigera yunnana]
MLKREHEEIKAQKDINEPNEQRTIKMGLAKHLSPAESPLNFVIPTRTYSSKESVCRMLQFSPESSVTSQSVNKTPCPPNEPVQPTFSSSFLEATTSSSNLPLSSTLHRNPLSDNLQEEILQNAENLETCSVAYFNTK